MVRLERRRVKKRLASVQFDAATNHMNNFEKWCKERVEHYQHLKREIEIAEIMLKRKNRK